MRFQRNVKKRWRERGEEKKRRNSESEDNKQWLNLSFISLKRSKLMSSEKLIVTWLFALFFSCCEINNKLFPRQRPTAEASAILVAIDPLFDHYRLEDSRTLQDLSYRISMASKNGFAFWSELRPAKEQMLRGELDTWLWRAL